MAQTAEKTVAPPKFMIGDRLIKNQNFCSGSDKTGVVTEIEPNPWHGYVVTILADDDGVEYFKAEKQFRYEKRRGGRK